MLALPSDIPAVSQLLLLVQEPTQEKGLSLGDFLTERTRGYTHPKLIDMCPEFCFRVGVSNS